MKSEEEQLQAYMGKVIKIQRQKKNLTLEKLAEKANLNNTNIDRIERGEQLLSFKTYYKLVIALELDRSDYLPGIINALKTEEP